MINKNEPQKRAENVSGRNELIFFYYDYYQGYRGIFAIKKAYTFRDESKNEIIFYNMFHIKKTIAMK